MDIQSIFDVISDPTRRRILALLMTEGELCVCELMFALDDIQPKVSRHLSVMREAELVTMRREGTWVFYRIAPSKPAWICKLLEILPAGAVIELAADRARLKKMAGRPARAAA
jgi:ArsR family transcriptional regulator